MIPESPFETGKIGSADFRNKWSAFAWCCGVIVAGPADATLELLRNWKFFSRSIDALLVPVSFNEGFVRTFRRITGLNDDPVLCASNLNISDGRI